MYAHFFPNNEAWFPCNPQPEKSESCNKKELCRKFSLPGKKMCHVNWEEAAAMQKELMDLYRISQNFTGPLFSSLPSYK